MSTSTPFLPKTSTKTIAASVTTASATWAETDKDGDCVYVFNATAGIAFVRLGKGAQTAVITDFPIAPNTARVIGCQGSADSIGVILSTGTGNVYATKGEGV